jgi:tRNA-2-methylthio-N6-dimethylallyladenosine synthase
LYGSKFKKLISKQNLFAFVRTYGCQQNVSDSEKIKGLLLNMGCSFVKEKKDADIIVFNTCAVRENAEFRVLGNIGMLKDLKKQNPKLIIAICGCMTQQYSAREKIKSMFPFVDIIIGTDFIDDLRELIFKVFVKKYNISGEFNNNFIEKYLNKKLDENLTVHRDSKIKAFVPIMNGCDNFCSYCIVPYVRGREISRKPEAIKEEIENLIDRGYKSITLLGQNVNSYGKNLNGGMNFTELLREITKKKGDYWIRFMTSHPKDITKELIEEIAFNDKICKHIHLPFQSGSNRILKKMNRQYTREKYISIVEYARNKIPDISLTSDVIVGFPSESYYDFKQTISLVKLIGFSSLFTFIYSKREGTPAAKMKDLISHEEKSKRLDELLKLQREISSEFCSKFVGKKERVLLEEGHKNGLKFAKTNQNITVFLENYNDDYKDKFCNVKFTGHKRQGLTGIIQNR